MNPSLLKPASGIIFLFLTATVIGLDAQTPNTAVQPGAGTKTVVAKPVIYEPEIPLNKITVWEATSPQTTEASIISTNRTLQEVKQTNQYFDGVGRPLQTVVKGISPLGKDIVTPLLYNAYGRETLKYLPYISTTNDGTFKLNPFHGKALSRLTSL